MPQKKPQNLLCGSSILLETKSFKSILNQKNKQIQNIKY
jgi:hypothetical protein